jgi:hypothetical protein
MWRHAVDFRPHAHAARCLTHLHDFHPPRRPRIWSSSAGRRSWGTRWTPTSPPRWGEGGGGAVGIYITMKDEGVTLQAHSPLHASPHANPMQTPCKPHAHPPMLPAASRSSWPWMAASCRLPLKSFGRRPCGARCSGSTRCVGPHGLALLARAPATLPCAHHATIMRPTMHPSSNPPCTLRSCAHATTPPPKVPFLGAVVNKIPHRDHAIMATQLRRKFEEGGIPLLGAVPDVRWLVGGGTGFAMRSACTLASRFRPGLLFVSQPNVPTRHLFSSSHAPMIVHSLYSLPPGEHPAVGASGRGPGGARGRGAVQQVGA